MSGFAIKYPFFIIMLCLRDHCRRRHNDERTCRSISFREFVFPSLLSQHSIRACLRNR